MSEHDTCLACRDGKPCTTHPAELDTAAILAAVARETLPYNAPGGTGAPATDAELAEPRHRPLGLFGRAGGWLG